MMNDDVNSAFVAQFILVERTRWKSCVKSFSARKFLQHAWDCWRGVSMYICCV